MEAPISHLISYWVFSSKARFSILPLSTLYSYPQQTPPSAAAGFVLARHSSGSALPGSVSVSVYNIAPSFASQPIPV
ncbi:hypothetical protein FVER53590_28357 [Fusarium verticillioides]|nr:hypothetical protein FVER53590_28357 [Fusarium verticillioides]